MAGILTLLDAAEIIAEEKLMEGQEEEEKTNMEKKVEKEEWIGSLKLQAI